MAAHAADCDVAVVGLGPAGLAAALALAEAGLTVTVVGPAPTAEALAKETRTTALFGGSVELLRHLGAWPALADAAAALTGLRLIDDTGRLLRAPETLFRASEIGREAFGYNIETAKLTTALHALAAASPGIRIIAEAVIQVAPGNDVVRLAGAGGTVVSARLVVGADGRASRCRDAAGVATETWSYPQTAIATRFQHSRPHEGISTELHRRAGPLTTVPMPGSWSSLVWVETPDEARRLAAVADDAFAGALETRLGGLLGTVSQVGARACFPLSGLTAKPLAQNRIALIGEAGHVLPPIGAQGLNLGLRDAAWITECAAIAKADGRDVGGDAVLQAFRQARAGDVASRTLAVDLLNRSLLADVMPLDLLRGAGLVALGALPWLRRAVMQAGLGPGGPLPRLLRPATA
ncbi:MAG: FAD-dependent monooxygenase [Hyphomicrobiaceae bacterium]